MPRISSDSEVSGAAGFISQWRFTNILPHHVGTFPRQNYGVRFDGPNMLRDKQVRTEKSGILPKRQHILPGMQGYVTRHLGTLVEVVVLNWSYNGEIIQTVLPVWGLKFGDVKRPDKEQWVVNYKYEFLTESNLSDLGLGTIRGPSPGLELSLASFLRLCGKSGSKWIPDDFHALTKKYSLGAMTKILMRALGKAATVLDKSDFTIEDLKRETRRIRDRKGDKNNVRFIVYWIWYEEEDGTTHLYVGKAIDVDNRLQSYAQSLKPGNSNYSLYHSQLRLKAKSRHMGVLFDLETADRYAEFAGIAEQVGVSFLETYRPALEALSKKVNSIEMICEWGDGSEGTQSANAIKSRQRAENIEHHLTFKAIAKEAFTQSGYVGAVNRPNFGVSKGVNWNSPLPEASTSTSFTQALWLQSEVFYLDPDSLTSYKIVSLAKSKKQVSHWISHDAGTGSKKYPTLIQTWYVGSDQKGTTNPLLRIQNTLTVTEGDDGTTVDDTQWPPEGTPVYTRFEVRLDWKAHPNSWARLPDVGPFGDWERANGWAFSIDWKDQSGKPWSRYLKVSNASSLEVRNKDTPRNPGNWPNAIGSRVSYDLGIALSRYIFGDPVQKDKPWLRECNGQMRVKLQQYNCLKWTLSFTDPRPVKKFPSGAYKGLDAVIAELKAVKYQGRQLLTVDEKGTITSLKRTDTERGKVRDKCDTCYMTASGKCERVPGTKTCFNNRKHGREVKTWSQGAPSASNHEATWDQLFKRKDKKGQAMRKALMDQPPEPSDPTVADDPNYRELSSVLTKDERDKLNVLLDEADDMEDSED
ncbi:hypothetical protein G6514_002207 [Epicoccum nigrum]|nr:hypothetical protein G6514_002207 [Epicoccum nigrum]